MSDGRLSCPLGASHTDWDSSKQLKKSTSHFLMQPIRAGMLFDSALDCTATLNTDVLHHMSGGLPGI